MEMYDFNGYLETLADRVKAQEETAYFEFTDYFAPRIRSLFLQLGLNRQDAEDLAEDCATDILLNAIKTYQRKPGGGLSAWVYVVARNHARSFQRRRQQAPPTVPMVGETVLRSIRRNPNNEVVAAVGDALAWLEDDERFIVAMHHFEGWTFNEIGTAMGKSENTIRVKHHRLLKRLENILQDDLRIQRLLTVAAPLPHRHQKED